MSASKKQQWAEVKYSQTQLGGGTTSQGTAFAGGLDLTTPNLRLQNGALRDVLNFEVAQYGGYARIDGYDRFSGQFAPHEANYTLVQLAAPDEPRFGGDAFVLDGSELDGGDLMDGTIISFPGGSTVNLPNVGDVVTQVGSGATGVVIAIAEVPNSSPVGYYLVLTNVTGIFDEINILTVL